MAFKGALSEISPQSVKGAAVGQANLSNWCEGDQSTAQRINVKLVATEKRDKTGASQAREG